MDNIEVIVEENITQIEVTVDFNPSVGGVINSIEDSTTNVSPTIEQLNALPISTYPFGVTVFYTNDAVLMAYTRMSESWLQSPIQKVI